jgi:hypothetical protein
MLLLVLLTFGCQGGAEADADLYEEDFQQEATDWPTVDEAGLQAGPQAGAYEMVVPGAEGLKVVPAPVTLTGSSLEMSASVAPGDAQGLFGLGCRQGEGDSYILGLLQDTPDGTFFGLFTLEEDKLEPLIPTEQSSGEPGASGAFELQLTCTTEPDTAMRVELAVGESVLAEAVLQGAQRGSDDLGGALAADASPLQEGARHVVRFDNVRLRSGSESSL